MRVAFGRSLEDLLNCDAENKMGGFSCELSFEPNVMLSRRVSTTLRVLQTLPLKITFHMYAFVVSTLQKRVPH